MRTHLFRGVMALAVLLTVSAVPALAQSVVRGKGVDAQGKPVADATVLFEATDANRKTQTKTDKNGDFLQVGLSSGAYKVTASKDGVGTQTLNSNVRQGPNNPMSFTLSASSNMTNADKEAAAALQAAAGAAMEAMKAGRHDAEIARHRLDARDAAERLQRRGPPANDDETVEHAQHRHAVGGDPLHDRRHVAADDGLHRQVDAVQQQRHQVGRQRGQGVRDLTGQTARQAEDE